ncbi:mitochondrial ribonuclease P protein 1 homolog [Bradysia coprophila]|uniref:mitochondrial ribonuclease P protein 1 homolog n=1 Tax=Bradysia coprophila TaxID=38358 RepID=UPI00187DB090|nr:mitochondrial ribonuclease P protein 1 homolog [Bradysia coprophila]
MVNKHCFCGIYSLHPQSSILNRATYVLPRKFDSFRLSSSSVEQENEGNSLVDEDRQIETVKTEIASIRQRGGRAPDINLIQKHHWNDLLSLKTTASRRSYYWYLFSREQTIKNGKLKRQKQKNEREQQVRLNPPQDGQDKLYSEGQPTFLLPVGRRTINKMRNYRLWRAAQLGEKLIFDCSYDEYMTRHEAKSAANQLAWSFTDNRSDTEPFDLHFCNVNFSSVTIQQLERNIPTMQNEKFPMHLHETSYVDLFPKEQLVYLTPHCDNDLTEYDPDMIYIIGAMVDKGGQGPLSLEKAKALDLKMARLPLDQYLNWEKGTSKYLTLDQMVRIMLDLKRTGKWEVALRHAPKRKVSSAKN